MGGVSNWPGQGVLATNTWSSYYIVWKNVSAISEETGINIEFPMSFKMLQAINIKSGHQVRGLECPALEHKLIQIFLKGFKNI